MAVVTYLLRADLRKRWRSLAMLALLVAIVVGAVLTATAGARRTRTAFDRYLEEVRPGDALVTFEGEPPDPATVEQIDGVEAAVDYRWFSVFPAGGPDGFYFIPLFVPDRSAACPTPTSEPRWWTVALRIRLRLSRSPLASAPRAGSASGSVTPSPR